MINAEKLLGGLLRQAISGGGRRRGRRRRRRKSGLGALLGGGLGGAAGLGVLGVAIAAFEHFTQKSGPPTQSAVPPQPATTPRSAPPPPPPGPPAAVPPPPPGAEPTPQAAANQTATLLIQAMIAAANADGHIDPVEEREILEKLGQAGMSLEEREFILRQMAEPPTLESLLPKIDTPELAKQVYAVSLLAIDVDTPSELQYMKSLRERLKLDEATAGQLEDELGATEQ